MQQSVSTSGDREPPRGKENKKKIPKEERLVWRFRGTPFRLTCQAEIYNCQQIQENRQANE
jgi:hypothetical protein